jgi:phosphoribosylanthranilate isomerase
LKAIRRQLDAMPADAKICGLSTPDAVEAALVGGAAFVGFVFFPKSPRNVAPGAAAALAEPARGRARIVSVTVDPTDAELDAIVAALKPDFVQLHGRETPERVAAVKAQTGAGVIKALPVSAPEDLAAAEAFEDVADYLMFDARPPAGSALPGGVGARFDWDMLAGRTFSKPWFLAGGLAPDNISEAIRRSGALLVDVSSGVETAPGLKDPRLISAFLAAVRSA